MTRSQYHVDFGIGCCLIALATCATAVRLFTRGYLQRQLRIDDVLALLATIFGIIEIPFHLTLIAFIRCARIQQARQQAGADPDELRRIEAEVARVSENAFRQNYVGSILYLIGIGIIKLAILTFLLRFLTAGVLRHATYAAITIVSMFALASTLAFIFQCDPVRLAWSYENLCANCPVEPITLHIVSSVFHLTSDLVIMALPMCMVVRLQVNHKRKIGLGIIFSVGILGTVATILRLREIINIIQLEGGLQGLDPFRFLPYMAGLVFWSQVELSCIIICANLPVFACLWKIIRERVQAKRSTDAASSIETATTTTTTRASCPGMSVGGRPPMLDMCPKQQQNSLSSTATVTVGSLEQQQMVMEKENIQLNAGDIIRCTRLDVRVD